jgi:twitching motility two-component system response regulator PilH
VQLGVQTAPAPSKMSGALNLSSVRCLVVDDYPTNRLILRETLFAWGASVVEADSGEQAMEALEASIKSETPFDLLLLDCRMPGMDGFEACRRLAEHPDTRSIPVVFVSTKAQRADQVWARMQGGREVIAKPYTAEHLLSAIERHAGLGDGTR